MVKMSNEGNEVQKQTIYQTFLGFYWLAKNGLHTVPEMALFVVV